VTTTRSEWLQFVSWQGHFVLIRVHIAIAVCTVLDSWWWTEELSEACRFLFQKQIREISASCWFYYKNILRCTVHWMSKCSFIVYWLNYNSDYYKSWMTTVCFLAGAFCSHPRPNRLRSQIPSLWNSEGKSRTGANEVDRPLISIYCRDYEWVWPPLSPICLHGWVFN
jgi:hypothetical protein